NLDDRRWADLVEEGRTLIPFYGPEWTDHNVHDPGITLIELFAWLAEMDVYQLNRIPDRNLRKFLALIGVRPHGPRRALAALAFAAKPNGAPDAVVTVPVGTEFEGQDAFGQTTRFQLLHDINIAQTELRAIQLSDKQGFHNLTERWQRSEELEFFGPDPQARAELYLGFSQPLPIGKALTLLFV